MKLKNDMREKCPSGNCKGYGELVFLDGIVKLFKCKRCGTKWIEREAENER